MALSKIWVHAEAADGTVAPITLEMLAKARELADTVEAFYAGDDADAVAGDARRPRRHQGARHRRPGRQAARASTWPRRSPPPSRAATPPTCIMFGTTYDGRDIAARLSVKLDKPVSPTTPTSRSSGDDIVVTEPDLRWHADRQDQVRRRRARTSPSSARSPSWPRSPVAAPPRWPSSPSPTPVPPVPPRSLNRHVEEATGPKLDEAAVVVSGGRGLGEADKYEMIEDAGQAAQGRAPAPPGPSSTPAGCPTATRWARPARS